jgi:NADPH:quinone reductase-like Zn-dependent oxidoreductase
MQQSLHAVRTGGTISLIGVLGGATAPLDLTPALMQGIRIQGVFVGHREAFEAMCRAIATHRVRPRIDRVFSFARTREALEYVASGSHCGKVCVSFEEPSSGSVGSRESTTTGVP